MRCRDAVLLVAFGLALTLGACESDVGHDDAGDAMVDRVTEATPPEGESSPAGSAQAAGTGPDKSTGMGTDKPTPSEVAEAPMQEAVDDAKEALEHDGEVAEESDALADAVEGLEADAGRTAPAHELHGRVSMSYRARKRGSLNDEDLYGYLSADLRRPEDRDLSLHLFARTTVDLDGDSNRRNNLFTSLNDWRNDDVDFKLYEAYADLEGDLAPSSLGVRRIRLGRHRMHAGLSFLMDGGRVDFDRVRDFGNLEISIFGGVPAYLYDSSRSEDWMAGFNLGIEPFVETRLEFRYVHISDKNEWIGGDRHDEFMAVSWQQKVFEELRFEVLWNLVGLDTRDARLRVYAEVPDAELTITASWFWQDDVTLEYTTPLDPFVGVLGTSFSYHQGELQVTKLFGEHFSADIGFTIRGLEDGGREASFNREFTRLWATLSTHRWPFDDLGLAVTVEWWDADDDESLTAGGELDWRPTKDLRINAGSYYSLYKYDLFVIEERFDVTTLFLRARWDVVESLRLDARYEFETGDEGDFHVFHAGFTWRF
ncbi:MAG: hypothetical protein KDB53_08595 [Planctomycetes bacterium]|nr:hypothetical protein [Planctomycetota bacterium]